MQKEIFEISNGNPGAMMVLMSMLNGSIEECVAGITIIPIIKEYGIKGTNLYVLWGDLCNKDLSKVAQLCKDCPKDILIDACSRQDYSGRALVQPYLK